MWLSAVTLYWRWFAIISLCAALFGAGAAWEGKRAERRLDAYKAAVEAAADKQAIHAGVITLESRKTAETIAKGVDDEKAAIKARYDAYRAAHPAIAARVQPSSPAPSGGPLPAVSGSPGGVAEDSAESRFVAALRGCEETAAQVRAWQQWYAENLKTWGTQ